MAICVNDTAHYVGKTVVFEYAVGCGDAKPLEASYKFVGACNTKGFTLGADTADATTDQTVGGVRDNLVTYLTYEASVDGKVRITDKPGEANTDLLKYYVAEIAAGRQPSVWTRMIFPDITIEAYCNLTNYERSAPDGDLVSFAATFSATASDFGVTVTDTV